MDPSLPQMMSQKYRKSLLFQDSPFPSIMTFFGGLFFLPVKSTALKSLFIQEVFLACLSILSDHRYP